MHVILTYALTSFSKLLGIPRAPQALDPASLMCNINNSSREVTIIVGNMFKLAPVFVDLILAEETTYKNIANLSIPTEYPFKEDSVTSFTRWFEENVWSPYVASTWLLEAEDLLHSMTGPMKSSKAALEEIHRVLHLRADTKGALCLTAIFELPNPFPPRDSR